MNESEDRQGQQDQQWACRYDADTEQEAGPCQEVREGERPREARN